MSQRRFDSKERLVKFGILRHEARCLSLSFTVSEDRCTTESEMLCPLRDFSNIYIFFCFVLFNFNLVDY
jgi:hypothetical protein